MFPVEFDRRMLEGLPLPEEEDVARVVQILKAIAVRRIMPHFKKTKGTDPIAVAQAAENLAIERFEDEAGRIRIVSLLSRKEAAWRIRIHERVFDYLAFVLPTRPESRLGAGTTEERKVLAFSEFMLRHQVEHILYPAHTEREIVRSDVAFALERRDADPTFYRDLRKALADEMNGLQGRPFLALFDDAEKGTPYDSGIVGMLNSFVAAVDDFPEAFLAEVFPELDTEIQGRVLGDCYRSSRDTSFSLLRRTAFLEELVGLFHVLLKQGEAHTREVFDLFRDRWGLVYLFQELGLPEATVDGKSNAQIFELFRRGLNHFMEETRGLFPGAPAAPSPPKPAPKPVASGQKSLKDRIDEVRNDPAFPVQVLEVIEKNKLNAVGHSGAKFSELIETLLAVPWNKIQPIAVSPQEFEQGLDRTHYGLRKPKDTVCDFFTNLIWRYRSFRPGDSASWRKNGSAFLFVGPPGVGKTSFAISIARNLGIPYHKLSLGGMRDEADLRGHGFTYEGSKPGAIVQGIIKMGIMNGMFIMDEADKTEKFAIATLLEILDPEQNHLFHDKYTETTVDVDLSNCHFVLTANTLETVPPPVINRCEVVFLDRYSVEEKIAIARQHLIERVRQQYQISENEIFFDPEEEEDLLKYLIKNFTHEAGVRELERLVRTLFLRIFRKEILVGEEQAIAITREKIEEYLEAPRAPRQINETDRVGEMMALGVNVELGIGTLLPVQATVVSIGGKKDTAHGFLSMVHATGNIQKIMDESRKVATTAILYCAGPLGIQPEQAGTPIHLHFMGASTPKDGPSAGGAIALALASALSGRKIRRDVAMTGEIDTQGRITAIGSLDIKLETAYDAGCRTVIIPKENLYGEEGVERLSDALKRELQILAYEDWRGDHEPLDYDRQTLQIIAVDHIVQAADVAFMYDDDLEDVETVLIHHAESVAETLAADGRALQPSFSILYVKDLRELELQQIKDSFWVDTGSILLAPPPVREAILKKFPVLEVRTRIWDFDPVQDDLAAVLEEIDKTIQSDYTTPVHLTMLAPFFFLIRQGVSLEGFSAGSSVEGLTLFANNYAAEGIKLKGMKALLNRVYHYLSQLGPGEIEACPFIRKQSGIHVVDLSFIPEKYRLDSERAAKILTSGLTKWLTIVEGYGRRGGSNSHI